MTLEELRTKVFTYVLPRIIPRSKAVPDVTAGWKVYLESDEVEGGSTSTWVILGPENTPEATYHYVCAQLGYGHVEPVRIPPGGGDDPPRRPAAVVGVF